MKTKIFALALVFLLGLNLLAGCARVGAQEREFTFTDALGRNISIDKPNRVVSLYGSFAEVWQLSGGELVGVTEDAVSERGMKFTEKTEVVGSVKSPNMERVVAQNPDFVILSADIAAQAGLSLMLTDLNIPHAYFRVDSYTDYLSMLELFCKINNRADLYEKNGSAVAAEIENILEKVKGESEKPTFLLLRAFSSGVKAKASDNLAGIIIEELGGVNIASMVPSVLEELSLEQIATADPDFIFVSIMGSDEALAMENLEATVFSNPVWQSLSAVKEEKIYVLPKELFHYKPNAKWGMSYEYVAKILYPEAVE